jgi:hypothetical protein
MGLLQKKFHGAGLNRNVCAVELEFKLFYLLGGSNQGFWGLLPFMARV